jgi:hypothetical protein
MFSSKVLCGLLSAKSDLLRKSKLEKDIKKVDVRNLEIRSSKPAKNSDREVMQTKTRRSMRRSSRVAPQSAQRSRSSTRMEEDDDPFSTNSARM